MGRIEIDALDDPRLDLYRDIKDPHMRRREGLFVVEGRFTLRCLIEDSPFDPLSVLASPPARVALQDALDGLDPETPIYEVPNEVLRELSGFHLHRGCLALGRRPDDFGLQDLLARATRPDGSSLLVVLEGLTNHDNVGGIFRNAMALGADGVVVCPRCCDPLYRKAIRTSLGAALCVPFARVSEWPVALEQLKEQGYSLVALDPAGESIASVARGGLPARSALFFGTEGAGLSEDTLSQVDLRLQIGMETGVDSLNVATASGIALHRFREALGR
ncbi:MAG TPA: RNA methyltransferase [Myxococcales bacterium]|nr:RNA methyltransferase [Myxococcales bacterium]HIL01964.1 RNA methyltransferase [Myxococcales bacterium]